MSYTFAAASFPLSMRYGQTLAYICDHGRRKGGGLPPLGFEIFSKKVVFLVLSGKKQILAPPGKILEKSPSSPRGNARVCDFLMYLTH